MVAELEQLRVGAKSWKAEIEALSRVNGELKEMLSTAEQALIARDVAHKAEMEKMAESVKIASESLAVSQKELEASKAKSVEMEAKMTLVPVVDASAGQAPVADGGSAPEPKIEVDHYAEWKKIGDHVEAANYYKAHKQEIDGQFK